MTISNLSKVDNSLSSCKTQVVKEKSLSLKLSGDGRDVTESTGFKNSKLLRSLGSDCAVARDG